MMIEDVVIEVIEKDEAVLSRVQSRARTLHGEGASEVEIAAELLKLMWDVFKQHGVDTTADNFPMALTERLLASASWPRIAAHFINGSH